MCIVNSIVPKSNGKRIIVFRVKHCFHKMESLNKLKVDELKKKCENLGLSTGGKKIDLIERIYAHELKEKERSIREMSQNSFQSVGANGSGTPLCASSPDFLGFDQNTPVVTTPSCSTFSTSLCDVRRQVAVPISTVSNGLGRNVCWADETTAELRQATIANTNPVYTNCNPISSTIHNLQTNFIPVSTFTSEQSSQPYTQRHASLQQQLYVPTSEQRQLYFPATPETFTQQQQYIPTSTLTQNGLATQFIPIQPHPLFVTNNVKDIMSILPSFDPADKSITSNKFIQRVEQLRQSYGWEDKILLFAVQTKLQGVAKLWIDSAAVVYTSWGQFVNAFLTEFPTIINVAEIHMKLMNMRRSFEESPETFYYKVLSVARNGNLDDQSVIKYVINGINDDDLKKVLSVMNFSSCCELLKTIISYSSYNIIYSAKTNATNKRNIEKLKSIPPNETATKVTNEIKCFNCRKTGHISRECPEPQKRSRCEICLRTGHTAVECKSRTKQNTTCNLVSEVNEGLCFKEVVIGEAIVKALVDSGSSRSLIRKSIVKDMDVKEKCYIRLIGFGGGDYECLEKIKMEMKIDDINLVHSILIIEDDKLAFEMLLGKDILCSGNIQLVMDSDGCHIQTKTINNINETLPTETVNDLNNVIKEYAGRFGEKTKYIGKCNMVKMNIKVTSDEPICMKPYRLPFARRPVIREIIDDMLEADVIRPSTSPYASPIVLNQKKTGEYRMCVDYRRLNKITERQPFPMPNIEDILAQLAGNKYFTVLDMKMGYYQIELEETAKPLTAFVTHDGHYEFNRMPFGLVNAPAVFQGVMNKIVEIAKPDLIIVYLDDVIIPSKTTEEGVQVLNRFLRLLEKCNLTLRYDKCNFLHENIDFLGHRIDENGIRPGKSKLIAIEKYKTPKNATEIRRFMGLCGFFRKFVQNFQIIAKPLTQLTKKATHDSFVWGPEQEIAFNSLKEKLCSEPVLALYDFDALHEVHTDASSVGLAGILMQSSDEGQSWKAVIYFSRVCTEAESRYHSYELEVLAVVESLARFRMYLLGKRFRIVTDCAAITTIKAKTQIIPRIARWWMNIMEYDFECVHRAGSRMAHVDAISRAPVEEHVSQISIDTTDWLLTMQLQDEGLLNIIMVLRGERKSDQENQIRKDYQLENQRLYRKVDGKLMYVVPKAARWRIVKYYHDDMGHFGIEKTKQRLSKHFWFPRMRKYVKDYIAACVECCYNKGKSGKPEGEMYINESNPVPFQTIHIDHLGPFLRSKKGYVYILAISDAFTKFLIVRPVRNTSTAPVLQILADIFGYFGLPERIVSDRGTAFTSKQFESFCNEYDIHHVKTAVRTPRANGQVERANNTILNFLRTSTNDPREWDSHLLRIQWTVNSQKNNSTGYSPHELLFNFKLRDVIRNKFLAAIIETDEYVPVDENQEGAQRNMQLCRKQWKERFDRRHGKPQEYEVNDMVMIQSELPSTGESRKLEPRFRGPYVVSKVLGKARYLLEDVKGMQRSQKPFSSVYTAEKMKRWCVLPPEDESDDEDDIGTMSSQERPSCHE